jgi:hypothetical protein
LFFFKKTKHTHTENTYLGIQVESGFSLIQCLWVNIVTGMSKEITLTTLISNPVSFPRSYSILWNYS